MMSALPEFINVKSLKGNHHIRDKILKVLYDYCEHEERFTSLHFVKCGNPNQWFVELYNLGITSDEVIPDSNGEKWRFISENQKDKAEEYLKWRGLISTNDESQRSN